MIRLKPKNCAHTCREIIVVRLSFVNVIDISATNSGFPRDSSASNPALPPSQPYAVPHPTRSSCRNAMTLAKSPAACAYGA